MTDAYAVFGNPIGHSKSPRIHAAFAAGARQDMSYGALEAPLGGFAEALRAFVASGGKGANVTAPFKLDAFAAADVLSERARAAGAVNALKFEGGRILAENFDGVGLVRDIEVNLGVRLEGRRVLLLGAGGAARGAAPALLARRPAALTIANRDADKARELAAAFAALGPVAACGYGDLADMPPFDVVLNSTSASWSGVAPPAPSVVFRARGARLRSRLWQGADAVSGAGARRGGRRGSPTASACWSSRRRKPFCGGAACGPTPSRVIAELTMPLI